MTDQEIINIIDIFAPLGEGYMMTNKEAIEIIQERIEFANKAFLDKHVPEYAEALKLAVKALEQTEWIPITYRDADEEERKNGYDYIFTCPMPDIGETVLLSDGKYIYMEEIYDEWFTDNEPLKEYNAWMPLPEPYRSE